MIHYFNPHSPCGERRTRHGQMYRADQYFNPHSPCGERHGESTQGGVLSIFQSTLPLRGATWKWYYDKFPQLISIHTPLAGSDVDKLAANSVTTEFQSTLPLRGATHFMECVNLAVIISIHTPLAGSDLCTYDYAISYNLFQSTLPLRGATAR